MSIFRSSMKLGTSVGTSRRRPRRAARDQRADERRRKAEERLRRLEREALAKEQARNAAVENFWKSLSDEERWRLEQAPTLQRQLVQTGGTLAEAAKKAILEAYALRMMEVGN